MPEHVCPRGFFQSSKDAYFYGEGSVILRRSGKSWVSEPAPSGHINGMCEREGRVYATSPDQLLLRRARGYFSIAMSKGDWSAGLSGEEFGFFDGAAGSSTDGTLLVGDRIEHFDGSNWTELFTDSGLGLNAIGQSKGWVLGLGKDGFLYQRDASALGNRFVRQQHLNATRLIVESPTDATVASAKGIYHWNGQSWAEQKGPPQHSTGLQIVGFARLRGQLRAFESNGQVLSLENGSWKILPDSDLIARLPRVLDWSNIDHDDSHDSRSSLPVPIDGLPRTAFEPCAAFQPRAEVVVLLSCKTNWGATYRSGNWTSYPVPDDIEGNRYKHAASVPSACVENDGCYVFGGQSLLRADLSAL